MGTGTYNRARQYGIEILDKEDIMSDDFSDRLIKAVKEHSPITLKWKKV